MHGCGESEFVLERERERRERERERERVFIFLLNLSPQDWDFVKLLSLVLRTAYGVGRDSYANTVTARSGGFLHSVSQIKAFSIFEDQ